MILQRFHLHSWWRFLCFLHLGIHTFGLNLDGVLLLSFKYSILKDPLGVLQGWNSSNDSPCSWRGVTCGSDPPDRVTGLTLPSSQLLGSLPSTLGLIPHLQHLDLSNNSINGSIPLTLFDASELVNVSLPNNLISGNLSGFVGRLKSLERLNLSDNALFGEVPENLTSLRNLTVVSLRNNYFSGGLPGGFNSVQILDLASNLINGSIPPNFGGSNIKYLNLSYNRLSGEIPPEFSGSIPESSVVDLSNNNLTGEIPEANLFFNQDTRAFSGNPELCGRPLRNPCPIPSSIATLPNASSPTSPPAIAAIPKTIDSYPDTESPGESPRGGKSDVLRKSTIIGIVVGDISGVLLLAMIIMYVYRHNKRARENAIKKEAETTKEFDWASSEASSKEEYSWIRSWTCLKKKRHADGNSTSESTNSDSEETEESEKGLRNQPPEKKGELVTVDGERGLELETLLKASAYILGASGSSIMYKAVLEDGSALAVRRIGDGAAAERFRDFEGQVKVIAKLVHPNLVRVRGFYWGTDEKLVIYDFVPNGSLANARFRKSGSSPCPLPWEMRLKIAKGVARGLTYIHEKKHVHGNLKPSNILLGPDMEPKIGDFGLERLLVGDNSYKAYESSRNFGSKRSTASRDSFHDLASGPTPSPSPSALGISPYHAPESLRSLRPSPKWDVFSFGVVLLELLTGKVIVSDDVGPGAPIGSGIGENARVLRMADVAIRTDMEGKEDAFLALVKIGYSCISPVPQKRPSMKEVLQGMDKFPSYSSSSPYF